MSLGARASEMIPDTLIQPIQQSKMLANQRFRLVWRGDLTNVFKSIVHPPIVTDELLKNRTGCRAYSTSGGTEKDMPEAGLVFNHRQFSLNFPFRIYDA